VEVRSGRCVLPYVCEYTTVCDCYNSDGSADEGWGGTGCTGGDIDHITAVYNAGTGECDLTTYCADGTSFANKANPHKAPCSSGETKEETLYRDLGAVCEGPDPASMGDLLAPSTTPAIVPAAEILWDVFVRGMAAGSWGTIGAIGATVIMQPNIELDVASPSEAGVDVDLDDDTKDNCFWCLDACNKAKYTYDIDRQCEFCFWNCRNGLGCVKQPGGDPCWY
jgi:hypothetical protein